MKEQLPIALCLFTSAKGHFGVTSRFLETIKSLNNKIPISNFSLAIANIKYEEESDLLWGMKENLRSYGFQVNLAKGAGWSHGNQTHQNGYLDDMFNIYSKPEVQKIPYILHQEDDFLYSTPKNNLNHWMNFAVDLLKNDPTLNQVRFARFLNEYQRINNLQKKHNINGLASGVFSSSDYFRMNDFSLNPSIFRSRDIYTALKLVKNNPQTFVQHVEHGLGYAMKVLGGVELPFACLNTSNIFVRHIGCLDKDIDPESGAIAEIV